MCEQCVAKAIIVVKDILPGYQLMQATVESEDWPKDWYGFVQCNDPLFITPGPFLEDPYKNMTDAEINASNKELEDSVFMESTTILDESLRLPLFEGYKFMTSCLEAGYNYVEHGTNVAAWLNDHVAECIKQQKELGLTDQNSIK